ncbi:ParB N-terminal domain-containing protein [Agromyces italicus]|uniref:ParB N-terminal domain-containing protein n=1 Tax=Agromyces italicus TaxID=279572 RepID=UPI0003B3522E|nr:ParB N-terminal domain-containing protein [Agromyces italicus]
MTAATPGHIELERAIDSIRMGTRHRTDLGDIDALAASIERRGLLQPITVTPDGVLVCGARRLAALRQLGVRKVNVWVRSGISDQLTRLLAEQDDNSLHKPLSPVESAALYREVKALLAEDAQRRQEASRFRTDGENPRSDGAAPGAAPHRGLGDTRRQAAQLVTGRSTYNTLERIGHLQGIAADEDQDEAVRAQAIAALSAIDQGADVKPEFQRLNAYLSLAELEKVAADASQESEVKSAALKWAAELRTAAQAVHTAELEELARDALARVKAASKSKRHHPVDRQHADASPAKFPARGFVYLWSDLKGWWLHYDDAELAAALTDEQWEQFETTLAGTIELASRVRALRSGRSALRSAS